MAAAVVFILAFVAGSEGCSPSSSGPGHLAGADSASLHRLPDTLRVVTLYSPTSYFIYRGQPMGYDYDLVERLAADKGMALKLEVAPSLNAAVEMLDSGKVDLIAYDVPVTAEYRDKVIPAGPEVITNQVLVQPVKTDSAITDVTQLVGRTIYVEEGSKYHARLNNLNEELGGGIDIRAVDRDTLITEDLIGMVDRGEIPLTIVDSDIAAINKGYYPDLDISLPLSFDQRAAWGVAPGNQWLADSIDAWAAETRPRQEQALLLKRYFEQSKTEFDPLGNNFAGGKISPYDDLFRKYAAEIGWDWRLCRPGPHRKQVQAQSHLMGRRTGPDADHARHRARLRRGSQAALRSRDEHTHRREVYRRPRQMAQEPHPQRHRATEVYPRRLQCRGGPCLRRHCPAKKYKMNSNKWNGNVEKAILMKMNPRYYRDPVVKYGYSRGRETYDYVRRIYSFYDKAVKKVPA